MFNPFKKKTKSPPPDLLSSDTDIEKVYQEGRATVTDLIAPSALRVSSNFVQVGATFAKTIFVTTYPRFLQTAWFSPLINLDVPMDISMFIHPIETTEILKTLRRSVTQVESQIHLEQEAGKVRDPVLETAMRDIEELRDRLQQGTERFFHFGLYITIYGQTKEKNYKTDPFLQALL